MKQINGAEIEIPISSPEAKKHFADVNNYSSFIIDEWESLPYSDYIKSDSVILDIGANVGLFALHVLPYAKRIICVEPTPEHMVIQKQLLKGDFMRMQVDNFEPRPIYSVIEHEQSALNYYTGKAKFRTEPVNTTMNTLRDAPDSYQVDCITLKDLCDKYGLTSVDFCKIDIEGSEWQALTIERIAEVQDIIKAFFVELHPRTIRSQNEMVLRFAQAGYDTVMVDYNGSIYCVR